MAQETPTTANSYWEKLSEVDRYHYVMALNAIYYFNSDLNNMGTDRVNEISAKYKEKVKELGEYLYHRPAAAGLRAAHQEDHITRLAGEVAYNNIYGPGLYQAAVQLMPPRSAFEKKDEVTGRSIEQELIGITEDGASVFQSIRKEGPTDEGTPGPITIR